jgi:membrane associated rhomboid family serine protease
MFFFPFRLDIALYRLPILVILISVACIGIFIAQQESEQRVSLALDTFCQPQADRQLRTTLLALHMPPVEHSCKALMANILVAEDSEAYARRLVDRVVSHPNAVFRDRELMTWLLLDTWSRFKSMVPDGNLTSKLWYRPDRVAPLRMLTAAFTHGDWNHLLGNIAMFIIFASALEIILGPLLFLAMFVMLALGTHLFYFVVSQISGDITPTIGLSGVVMGVMALLAWFIPRVKVRCLLWIIVIFRIVLVPAWLFVGWYVGWDAWRLFSGTGGSVNLVAHVSGGLLGVLAGMAFFRQRRTRVRALLKL